MLAKKRQAEGVVSAETSEAILGSYEPCRERTEEDEAHLVL